MAKVSKTSESYRHFLPKDFDKYDCVKLSPLYFIGLVFLLRAYAIWVMSVSNFNNKVGIIEILYPEPKLFYLHLASGVLGIFLLIIMSLRKPDAPNWVKNIWAYSRRILVAALVFDVSVNLVAILYLNDWQFNTNLLDEFRLIAQGIFCFGLIIACYQSERMEINLTEFPEPVPEK